MKPYLRAMLFTLTLFVTAMPAMADSYSDTRKMFEDAGASNLFDSAYAYALFPTIGKAGQPTHHLLAQRRREAAMRTRRH